MADILYEIVRGEVEIDDGDSYGSQAKFYDFFNERTDDYEQQEEIVEDYIPDGSSILYLGCGTGNLTKRIEENYEVTGLDLSREMLEISRTKTSADHLRADITKIPFQQNSFDAAVMLGRSMTYLHQDEDVEKVMEEVERVLDERGVFVFDNFREYTGDPEEELLGGEEEYHFGRMKVEMADEVTDYDPESHTFTWNVEYTVIDRSNGEEKTFRDSQRLRGFKPGDIRRKLQDNGFQDIEMEGRHGERKELEHGDNEFITIGRK